MTTKEKVEMVFRAFMFGCVGAFFFAGVFWWMDMRLLTEHSDMVIQASGSNVSVIAKNFDKATRDQSRVLNVELRQSTRLTMEARAQLSCRPGMILSHGEDKLLCGDTLGVLPAMSDAVKQLTVLFTRTDTNLNDKDKGILPKLYAAIDEAVKAEPEIIQQTKDLLTQGKTSVQGIQDVEKSLTALLDNKDVSDDNCHTHPSLGCSLKYLNLTEEEFYHIVYDFRHPKQVGPARWVNAFNVLYRLTEFTAYLRQGTGH